jgi:TolB-like protein
MAALLVFGVGCANTPFLGQATIPSYKPSNVYREEAFLPPNFKRVAVLPLTTLVDDATVDFGRDSLAQILLDELGRSRRFELVAVSSEELRLLTGRSAWSGEEPFPQDFFDKLRSRLGVDAVLFCRLTQFRAYEPLAVGWRLKLLDAEEPHILWAVDEVFDARVPEIAAAARRYAQQHPEQGSTIYGPQGVFVSPRRFGQYTVSAVVDTMPESR